MHFTPRSTARRAAILLVCASSMFGSAIAVPHASTALSGEQYFSDFLVSDLTPGGGLALLIRDNGSFPEARSIVPTTPGPAPISLPVGLTQGRMTGDAKNIIFVTDTKLDPADKDARLDVYRYTVASGAYKVLSNGMSWKSGGYDLNPGQRISISTTGNRIGVSLRNLTVDGPRVIVIDVTTRQFRYLDASLPAAGRPYRSQTVSLSANGNLAAFATYKDATSSVMYRYDWVSNKSTPVSKTTTGATAQKVSGRVSAISPDGRFVLFATYFGTAGTLYMRHVAANTTVRITTNLAPYDRQFSVSNGGLFVAFSRTGLIRRVGSSAPSRGTLPFIYNVTSKAANDLGQPTAPALADNEGWVSIVSASGNKVVFSTWASNFGAGVHAAPSSYVYTLARP